MWKKGLVPGALLCGLVVGAIACGKSNGGTPDASSGGLDSGGTDSSSGGTDSSRAGTDSGGTDSSRAGTDSGGSDSSRAGTDSGGTDSSSGGTDSGGTDLSSAGIDSGGATGTGATEAGGTIPGGGSSVAGFGSGDLGGSGPEAELIPDDRRIPWRPGIPGGVPERTTICATVTEAPYDAAGDGTADDSGAIQAALDACPQGQVVFVPAGTYRLTTGLAVPSGVVLRGAGPRESWLEGDGVAEKALVQAGSYDEENSPETRLVGGLEKGSTTLTAASLDDFAVGDFVIIDQLNDDDLVKMAGDQVSSSESACSWGSREEGTRLLGQMAEVVAIDDDTLTIEPPLAMSLSASLEPEMQRVRQTITRDVGIEDLGLRDRTFRGANNANIRFWGVAYSWIRNVESADVSGRHVQLTKAFRCEVRDSYLHHAHVYDSGANAYGLTVDNQTTYTLVENNIVMHLNAGIMMASSGPGNVTGYNFQDEMFNHDYPDTEWLSADMSANHCAHPFMNLHEGNQVSQIQADNIHGSSSHQTFFRNHVDRQHEGYEHGSNLTAVVFAANNRYNNVLGNVLGQPGDDTLESAVYEQTNGNCVWNQVAVFKLGYPSNCGVDELIDPLVTSTTLRHGNYDYVSAETKWDPSIVSRELPPSLYLDGKPDWFGDVPWPPIGPDVDGLVHEIPALRRYRELLEE